MSCLWCQKKEKKELVKVEGTVSAVYEIWQTTPESSSHYYSGYSFKSVHLIFFWKSQNWNIEYKTIQAKKWVIVYVFLWL